MLYLTWLLFGKILKTIWIYGHALSQLRMFIDLDLSIPKEARVINGFNVGVLKVTISMGNSHAQRNPRSHSEAGILWT